MTQIRMLRFFLLTVGPLIVIFIHCMVVQAQDDSLELDSSKTNKHNDFELVVLGVAQDAGYPQLGCRRECCQRAWQNPSVQRHPTSLAIVDKSMEKRWLVECTPAITQQLHLLDEIVPTKADGLGLDGIFVTHAHIGHYTGLMYVGREAIGAQGLPVYAMPRMRQFLSTSGPWRQLLTLENIELWSIKEDTPVPLNDSLHVTPILVPHRDEFSETVGFRIKGPNHSALFIPDIDKWEKWERKLEVEIAKVDVAFLDATFFDDKELPGRDMSQIPHPLVVETMQRLKELPAAEKSKVHFIHFNHTNPLLNEHSVEHKRVIEAGFNVAKQGGIFDL